MHPTLLEQHTIPTTFNTAIDYTLRVLLEDWPDAIQHVAYGTVEHRDIPTVFIRPSGFFSERNWLKPASLPNLSEFKVGKAPSLFGFDSHSGHGNHIQMNGDIIASSFFLLSRYEEFASAYPRDPHGRFLGAHSIIHQANLLDTPLVDLYRAHLHGLLSRLKIPSKPRKRRSHIYLTHDIDRIGEVPTARTLFTRVRRNPTRTLQWIRHYLGRKTCPSGQLNKVYEFNKILDAGALPYTTHFFVHTGKPGRFDRCYPIENQWVRDKIRELDGNIGLHVSYYSGANPDAIIQEKATLEQITDRKIKTSRHHYLRFIDPTNAKDLFAAGITDDFSMTYADKGGFRLGTSRPVPAFCPRKREEIGLTYHPTTIMDRTLDHYMSLEPEQAFHYCVSLFRKALHHGGDVVLLWHPEYLIDRHLSNFHRPLYIRLLQNLCEFDGTTESEPQ